MIKFSIFLFSICLSAQGLSQILHTESFSVIIDTTRTIKGSIVPDFKFQNLKEDLLEVESVSDITFCFDKNAITFANKIELAQYGKETLLSGGFIYLEFRRIVQSEFEIEPYSQLHWAEARGLDFKYAGGVNVRYRIHATDRMGVYAGTGPFFELERWNYDGVPDDDLPEVREDIEQDDVKLGSYVSWTWQVDQKISLDISLYHQSRFDRIFNNPRLASSSSLRYRFTEFLSLILRYQNIYDPEPVVPIAELYNKMQFSVSIDF